MKKATADKEMAEVGIHSGFGHILDRSDSDKCTPCARSRTR